MTRNYFIFFCGSQNAKVLTWTSLRIGRCVQNVHSLVFFFLFWRGIRYIIFYYAFWHKPMAAAAAAAKTIWWISHRMEHARNIKYVKMWVNSERLHRPTKKEMSCKSYYTELSTKYIRVDRYTIHRSKYLLTQCIIFGTNFIIRIIYLILFKRNPTI